MYQSTAYARAYFNNLVFSRDAFDAQPEHIEELDLGCGLTGAAPLPTYPTRKGLHLLRRVLPEVPTLVAAGDRSKP
jgi:hypothetical protein